MIVFPNDSLVLQLQALVTGTYDGLCDCKLYQNFVALDGSTVLGDLTEADFGGYAPVSPATWQAATLIGVQLARAKQNLATFTCDGTAPSNWIYGAYFVNGGALLAVTSFAAGPVLVSLLGQVVGIEMPLFLGPQEAI